MFEQNKTKKRTALMERGASPVAFKLEYMTEFISCFSETPKTILVCADRYCAYMVPNYRLQNQESVEITFPH